MSPAGLRAAVIAALITLAVYWFVWLVLFR